MARYGNTSAIPLSLGVFLATDNYDHDSRPNTISVTTLLKPLRQIILGARIPEADVVVDLAAMVNSRMGSAIHDAIERAWTQPFDKFSAVMQSLGYPQRLINNILINPTADAVAASPGCIPVYLEQRKEKTVGKWIVTGKYDFVGDGRVEDFKSTSTYTAINNTNDDKYSWQGSLYRWLNPTIITKDHMAIQWIFTDWSKAKAMQDPKYPQARTQEKLFPLKSLAETQAFVERKLALIDQYWEAKEADIPACNDDDLWRSEPVFKYYKSGDTTAARSTKNFGSMQEAHHYMHSDGKGIGAIKTVPGQVTACRYCAAFTACSQKDTLIACGDLIL